MDNSEFIDKKPSRAKTIWLIVVILALIASSVSFTLFYLKQKSEIDTLKAQNSKLADDNKSLESENNKVVVPQGEYRDIPELGVKYKVTDETKEITYVYNPSGTKAFVNISTVALSKDSYKATLDGDPYDVMCSLDTGFTPTSIVFGLPGDVPVPGMGEMTFAQESKAGNKSVKKISDTVYAYFGGENGLDDGLGYAEYVPAPSNGCDQNLIKQAQASAKELFESLEPIE